MKIYDKTNKEILTLSDWLTKAPPAKGTAQLKELKSALELAKCWFREEEASVPNELQAFFENNELTKDLVITVAYPEKETKLDSYGKGRNHDLVLLSETKTDKILISIEAKADEPYGRVINQYIKSVSSNSRVPNRIEELTSAILGDKENEHLRYQLLHAIAGTIIEAGKQHATKAILLVHEFHSSETSAKDISRNEQDLNTFLSQLFDQPVELQNNQLLGPINVNGGENVPKGIPLYVGRVVTQM